MNRDQELKDKAYNEIEQHKKLVESDPYRMAYHLMPPVGLLNDPNGFIQWNGVYHLFFQWMPFHTGHGAKFWGHYTSNDLVTWKLEPIALAPSEWYEKNGCYSGSAVEHEGKLKLLYTGNVKDELGNRETYQCLAESSDGIHFDKKGPVIHLPEGYTPHFRDPKVWEHEGQWYMVIGAQTKDLKGSVVLFQSDNLENWEYKGAIVSSEDLGYMWECPDLFHVDGKDVLLFSPQGLEPQGLHYHNVYQTGYMLGKFDYEKVDFNHGSFQELDRGFEFYAPQTMVDEKGRRIMIGWMGVPDQNEDKFPTIPYKWNHNMTIPRELSVENGKIIQTPVKELKNMRQKGNSYELSIEESTWDDYLDQLTFFVKAPLLLTKAILPGMKAKNEGRIINIGSEVVQLGNPNFANYVTAKSSQIGMTRSWANELGPFGITVNLINPGFIPVERHSDVNPSSIEQYKKDVPLRKMGQPTDIGNAVVFLASEQANFITGQSLSVNGGNTFGI